MVHHSTSNQAFDCRCLGVQGLTLILPAPKPTVSWARAEQVSKWEGVANSPNCGHLHERAMARLETA